MQIINRKTKLRDLCQAIKSEGQSIAFVATMGNLHAGHLRLVEAAKRYSDKVIVSIFVNPLQFGPDEDFQTYPRSLEQDLKLLATANITAVFTPTPDDVFLAPKQHYTYVTVEELTTELCGKYRPGHFQGVATILTKLFNLIQPNYVYFGEKDYQQLLLVKQLVKDLEFDTTVIGVPTQREADGLAMSSRNRYLSTEQRHIAAKLHASLKQVARAITNGETAVTDLLAEHESKLTQLGFRIEYLTVRDSQNLKTTTVKNKNLIILVAAYLGDTRLIDNLKINRQ